MNNNHALYQISAARALRQHAISWLRKSHLLPLAEWARFKLVEIGTRGSNAAFLARHPDFVPPPAELMNDAYSSVSYEGYLDSGKLEASMIAGLIAKYKPDAKRVLEWGCGPARIIRHLPGLLPQAQFYGVDYNARSIAWCQKAIPGIIFAAHGLTPPLPTQEKFDVIYAISVLTHLSIAQQDAWVAELRKALNPGGILIMTTHGERCMWVLLPQEREMLDAQGVLARDGVMEGKRCYTSYHHPWYVRAHLFAGLTILEHILENPCPHTTQDIWIVQAA